LVHIFTTGTEKFRHLSRMRRHDNFADTGLRHFIYPKRARPHHPAVRSDAQGCRACHGRSGSAHRLRLRALRAARRPDPRHAPGVRRRTADAGLRSRSPAPNVLWRSSEGYQPTAWLRKLHDARSDEIAAAGLADDWPAFRRKLSEIRRNGFYVSRGELEADLSAVAAPIRAAPPEAQSALALVTSSERFELLNIDVLSRLVVNGAGEIGEILTAT
jgi:hypothetical protein